MVLATADVAGAVVVADGRRDDEGSRAGRPYSGDGGSQFGQEGEGWWYYEVEVGRCLDAR